MNSYVVAEHFASVNGEGQRAGAPAYFVRFAGCNLRCSYCDTAWAQKKDGAESASFENLTTEQIVSLADASGIVDVTLTGGEPLLQPGAEEVIIALQSGKLPHSVEIETNGSVDLAPFASLDKRPVFTMDYKLPGSGMESFMNKGNMKLLQKQDSVKFVASDQGDLDRALEIIEEYDLQNRCGVFISPVFGSLEPDRIVDLILKHRLNGVRVGLQLHKFIWDPQKRGV